MDIIGLLATGPTERMVISVFLASGLKCPNRDSFGLPVTGDLSEATMVGTAVIGVATLDSTAVSTMGSVIMDRGSMAADGRAEPFTIIPQFGE